MSTLVFLGPSLEASEATRRLSAEFRPPVKRHDLPEAVRAGFQRIAIIDGEFGQSMAVSLAEVRAALRAGVEVWGASSMGALRAAECQGLGMKGVGWVFQAYADGRIDSDDEVALLFDAENGRALSVPLVNVRWSLECAVLEGVLSAPDAAALLALAQSLRYEERTYRRMVQAAAGTALAGAAEVLTRSVAREPDRMDRKRLDALALLDALAARGTP